MDYFTEIERSQVLDFYDKMIYLTSENEPLEILTQMQNYLCAVLKSENISKSEQHKIIDNLKTIEDAKKQLGVNMNIQTVFENLSFKLVL